jgi:hypothetical protein
MEYKKKNNKTPKNSVEKTDGEKIACYSKSLFFQEKDTYFANGINPTDIAHLKYKNIEGDYLMFERAKTENATRLAPKPITVYITEDMRHVIDYWGNKDKSPNNYIFPVLQHGMVLQRSDRLN